VADLRVVVQESENKDNMVIGRAVLVPPGWNMTYPEGTTTEAHGSHQTNTTDSGCGMNTCGIHSTLCI